MPKIFKTPLTPISWGELIDKITILEIKKINIKAPLALNNINKELSYLNQIVDASGGVYELIHHTKQQLSEVNKLLWQVEDDIREKDLKQEFDSIFIGLARKVYQLNDDRAKLKKAINQTLKSELVEEKSYKDFHN